MADIVIAAVVGGLAGGKIYYAILTHDAHALAQRAGLTPSHFCRVFKKSTGTTPHQYVMKARLDRAQELLGASDMSIAAIADRLGFTSQSHFTRAFRQYAGQTPSGWRHTIQ